MSADGKRNQTDAGFIDTDMATVSEPQLTIESQWADDSALKLGMEIEVKAKKGWTIRGQFAPRMTSLAEGTDDQAKFCRSGMPDLVDATHKLYSVCGLTHGDISPANVHFYYSKEGKMVGVISDFDHHRPEEVRPHAR